MLRWIFALACLCAVTAYLDFGRIVPIGSTTGGLCLVIFALSATLLIGSFEAYETQAARVERDDR
jgi:hypothetical protein